MKAHPSHSWIAADDIIECADCMTRRYDTAATEACPRTIDYEAPTPTEIWWIVKDTELGGSETLMFATEKERDTYATREQELEATHAILEAAQAKIKDWSATADRAVAKIQKLNAEVTR